MFTDLKIPISKIEVSDDRQRRKVDISGLDTSIKKWGLINPITVDRLGETGNYRLVAGERRLEACKRLGFIDISARLSSTLSATERQVIELEENIKRQDLEWKDFCLASLRIHKLYQELESSWTQEKTAESISLEPGTLSIILRVGNELTAGNPLIQEAANYRAAYNVIARRDNRKADDAFNDLMGGIDVLGKEESTSSGASPAGSEGSLHDTPSGATTSSPPVRTEPVLNTDFTRWVADYTGPCFTFLHCDFPYGIGLDKSDQGHSATWGSYGDSEDVYWGLCQCLVDNLDKLMAPSSHLMFWLSSDIGIVAKTLKFFMTKAPSLTFNSKMLIWHKSDGKGILPDPKRGPRHVYETAIFASRGDRLIAQAVADCFSCPKGDAVHQSEKPEPMLRHFFRMFIDSGTPMLDPTCGSGTSLCAAESLGASVTGLEINEEWAEGARSKLRTARLLRSA